MLHISEKHQYDSTKNVVIFSNGCVQEYDNVSVKIAIYKERIDGWFLSVAHQLTANGMSPGDYVALMVALSYFEGAEQFRAGKETPSGQSGKWFRKSAKRIFLDQEDDVINRLWKETRCGLFHSGFPNGYIYLSHDGPEAILSSGAKITINPKAFLDKVSADHHTYISELENASNTELRANFEKLWDILWAKS